ncbi:MAG: hypothetical protein M3446_05475, partial [Actinomycetota bacterium]|nr:hypothetical protein [Actinomycetota bacterium]
GKGCSMTIDRRNVRALVRAIAYDVKGSRLGRVAQVFLDDRTDEPAWVAVDVTRVRGMRLLPLAGAGLKGRYLVIRAERSTVRSAPRIDLGDGQLSSQDESRLLEHYGLVSADPGEAVDPGEQRPASPWSDDTERETAWERPAQQQDSRDTHGVSHGWEQPIRDRGDASPGVGTGVAAGVGAGVGAGPFQQRDTAPAPTIAAPAPPSSTEPATGADATGSSTPPASASAPSDGATADGPSAPARPSAEPATAGDATTTSPTPALPPPVPAAATAASPTAPKHRPSEPATAETPGTPAQPPPEPTTAVRSTPPPEPPEPPRPDAGSTAARS